VLLSALAVFLLFTEPRRWFEPRLVCLIPLSTDGEEEKPVAYYKPWPLLGYPYPGRVLRFGPEHVGAVNSFVMTLLAVMLIVEFLFPLLGMEVAVSVGFLKTSSEATSPSFKLSTRIMGTPWHTFCVMALWLWAGWQVLRRKGMPHAA
jgi:hypothetical protein